MLLRLVEYVSSQAVDSLATKSGQATISALDIQK